MDITAADFAVEIFIAEGRAIGFTQFGGQMAVGGVRRRIRQGHAGQRIEVTQAGTGQFQAQVQGTQIERIGQGPGQLDMAVGNADPGLQRERLSRVLQCQQTANFTAAVELLTVVLAFDLEGERIVLRFAALLQGLFRVFFADDLAKRDGFAQRVDQHVQSGFQGLVIEGHMPLVEADSTDVQRPG